MATATEAFVAHPALEATLSWPACDHGNSPGECPEPVCPFRECWGLFVLAREEAGLSPPVLVATQPFLEAASKLADRLIDRLERSGVKFKRK